MPAKPLFVGGTNPSSDVPVSGGSLWGNIMNMANVAQSAGGMFGGKGTPGSPGAPTSGGQPVNPQMPGAQASGPGQQQAGQIFGGTAPMGGTGGPDTGGAGSQDFMTLLMRMLGPQQQVTG